MSEIRVFLGGDVCPTECNARQFREGDASLLFGDLLPDLQQADLTLVNLECPLVEGPTPVIKSGPVLQAHPDCAKALQAAGVDAVSVANNHAWDHGGSGLKSTLAALQRFGVSAVGAGANRTAAAQPLVRRLGDIRVGVVALAEREFCLGNPDSWYVNPLDVLACARSLPNLRRDCHYAIVMLHGGVEHYPYPSPKMRDVARFLVDQGADLVVFQHSHCAGCCETYGRGTIVYGQGNLLFQTPQATRDWNEGLLLEIRVSADRTAGIELIPCQQSEETGGTRRMPIPRREAFLSDFRRRSEEILAPSFVEDRWREFCRKQADAYLGMLRGYGRIRGKVNRLTGHVRRATSSRDLALLCNLVRCEAHQEILVTLLEDLCSQRQALLASPGAGDGRRPRM